MMLGGNCALRILRASCTVHGYCEPLSTTNKPLGRLMCMNANNFIVLAIFEYMLLARPRFNSLIIAIKKITGDKLQYQ